jgi:hypothetical protein
METKTARVEPKELLLKYNDERGTDCGFKERKELDWGILGVMSNIHVSDGSSDRSQYACILKRTYLA